MTFSYKAVMHNPRDGSRIVLEFPEDQDWTLTRNDQPVTLREEPRLLSDGGTTTANSELGILSVPQRMFPEALPGSPTLGGSPLTLVEWWIGGHQYV